MIKATDKGIPTDKTPLLIFVPNSMVKDGSGERKYF